MKATTGATDLSARSNTYKMIKSKDKSRLLANAPLNVSSITGLQGPLPDLTMASASPVSEFYRDRCILVTGATGFMGKVLVEKLLRSCPGIRNVYLLMRPKGGQDVRHRLEELLAARLFENLKRDQPEMLNKLVPIMGDIMQPALGISQSDTKLLVENVSVVFHSAATVKFDEALKLSVEMNVLGTKRLVELCHKMTQLVSLVHVSTAYCNCDREEVTETVHPPPIHPQKLIDAVQWMDSDLIKTITPQLIGARPNTYTYTKAMAEYMLVEECGSLPVAIVRPSIVTAAWKEPIPGWVDNLNGPTGLIIGAGKGVLRSALCHSDFVADLVPVDIPINLMISVAWYTATHRPNNVLVYNCTSGNLNQITWGDVERYCYPGMIKNPMNDVFWYPSGRFRKNRFMYNIDCLVLHYLPAYVVDSISWLTGKKPRMVRIQEKMHRALQCLEYFTTHQWRFTNDNLKMIWAKLLPEDRALFSFDITQVSWQAYCETYCLGAKVFILKEELSTLPAARKHLNKMLIISHIFNLLKLLVIWRLLLSRSATARRVYVFLLSLATRLFQLLPLQWRS